MAANVHHRPACPNKSLPIGARGGLAPANIKEIPMAITLYGISNCDTVAKARKWLEGNGYNYTFFDYKKGGADPVKLKSWVDEAGLDKVLNKSGTTFKKLPEGIRAIMDEASSIALMAEQPSMIKRPIVEYDTKHGTAIIIGFKAPEWAAALG
jgi:arsenate reductase